MLINFYSRNVSFSLIVKDYAVFYYVSYKIYLLIYFYLFNNQIHTVSYHQITLSISCCYYYHPFLQGAHSGFSLQRGIPKFSCPSQLFTDKQNCPHKSLSIILIVEAGYLRTMNGIWFGDQGHLYLSLESPIEWVFLRLFTLNENFQFNSNKWFFRLISETSIRFLPRGWVFAHFRSEWRR